MFKKLFQSAQQPPKIVVTEEAVQRASSDPAAIAQDIVTYTNTLFDRGRTREQILPFAHRVFALDYYIAQVMNGGHWQFLHNAGQYPHIYQDVSTGMQEVAALGHLDIFRQALQWMQEQPTGTNWQQLLTSGAADSLQTQDAAFDQLERQRSLYQHIAAYVQINRDRIEIVPNTQFSDTLKTI